MGENKMNPEFTKISVEPKTHKINVTLRWHDGSEKILSQDDLRYRLGNCSQVNENQDAYQLALQNIAMVEAFLDNRTAFGKWLVSLNKSAFDVM
jgi:hypothetical protein